jgi:hypothetical protein
MTSALRGHRASESYTSHVLRNLWIIALAEAVFRVALPAFIVQSLRIGRFEMGASECERWHRAPGVVVPIAPHTAHPGYRDSRNDLLWYLFSHQARRSGNEYLIPKVLDLFNPTIPRPSSSLIFEFPNRL